MAVNCVDCGDYRRLNAFLFVILFSLKQDVFFVDRFCMVYHKAEFITRASSTKRDHSQVTDIKALYMRWWTKARGKNRATRSYVTPRSIRAWRIAVPLWKIIFIALTFFHRSIGSSVPLANVEQRIKSSRRTIFIFKFDFF